MSLALQAGSLPLASLEAKLQRIQRISLSSRVSTLSVLSHFSSVRLFATLWTVACHAPLSVGFSRQEYWSGLPCPPPGDLPDPGTEPRSVVSPALTRGIFTTSPTWEAQGFGGYTIKPKTLHIFCVIVHFIVTYVINSIINYFYFLCRQPTK